jgi:tRNA modification GTPase
VVEGWRERLIQALGLTEAAIDFSDEGDVSQRAFADASSIVVKLLQDIKTALTDGRRGEILRDGFRVAIVGAPNVGKSSLINALSRREVAIVSDEPGTTRDVVEVALDLAGIPVLFADTAGLRETAGKVEREGIRRSIERARDADLILWLRSVDGPNDEFPTALALNCDDQRVLAVCNKIDLTRPTSPFFSTSCIGISTLSGAGIADLISTITERAVAAVQSTEPALVTRERHRRLLEEIGLALDDFLSGAGDLPELRAEDLRRAANALGRITGRVDSEDVLGEIFGRFCIGK